ncbi:MAG TPA: HAD-IC family P-type ATPase [Steroidobacteraceae bacterium]|nr:HAD-IC family P-type ATPase [Steroidobacteraceae bacterium]
MPQPQAQQRGTSDRPATDGEIGTPAHAQTSAEALALLRSRPEGLRPEEAVERLARYGSNALPRAPPRRLAAIFWGQFKSPLIYVLLFAAVLSLGLEEYTDAAFIAGVLLVNALIGTAQEFGAQRSAESLSKLVTSRATVKRAGEVREVNAEELVPGDIVLLDSGARVPADLRLLDVQRLSIDESLLTGESDAVNKRPEAVLPEDTATADRINIAFAGTIVGSGRGRGLVVATGGQTALGRIASDVLGRDTGKPPLVLRMERFTVRIAIAVAVAALSLAAVSLARGVPLAEIFMLAVALAVSAIPEGLPVALTVALAVGLQRMARRNVIVRRLVAVEALGSCTCIASDKTGTLTVNQLTVRVVQLPDQPPWIITGEGLVPEGTFVLPEGAHRTRHEQQLAELCTSGALANEAVLARRDGEWSGRGDTVDLALLVLARKAGLAREQLEAQAPELASIAYEPALRFSAALNGREGCTVASVKGALETLLPMCSRMLSADGPVAIEPEQLRAQGVALAREGYRVLALAAGELPEGRPENFCREDLAGLTFLGLVGMTDPLRPEALAAVEACEAAGVDVRMITGDDPETALAIARDLGLAQQREAVVTGRELQEATADGDREFDARCNPARVFARVEPHQKLEIVQSLQRGGQFVAVTGDGVNDAPALRAAQVGVAMGRSGTDVARETAEIILTDDNFASVVAGVEEGRIAYGNIRKVIFLLISTGAAEIVLFMLAVIAGLPLPLLAVQLLWLNLVTNGIQDVALAFEPGEGDELRRPPRPPNESIFNRIMIERVSISALVMGVIAFLYFQHALATGQGVEEARNSTLLLMVLFENMQAFNSRSETKSIFVHNPLRNKILLFGTVIAQLVHIGAMYTPGLSEVLGVAPVSLDHWLELLLLAFSLVAVMELQKLLTRRRTLREKTFPAI